MTIQHTPIMVKEIIDMIPPKCLISVDGTAGHGGHIIASILNNKITPYGQIIAIDRDAQMLAKAQINIENMLQDHPGTKLDIAYIQDSYARIAEIVPKQGVDFLLLDIGVNMEHFKDGSRGFSVHEDALLDMRFDTRKGQTAGDILNSAEK